MDGRRLACRLDGGKVGEVRRLVALKLLRCFAACVGRTAVSFFLGGYFGTLLAIYYFIDAC